MYCCSYSPRSCEELQEQFKDIVVGKTETFKDQLKPILSNERLFFTDLYKDGVGEKIEEMFREMLAGPGSGASSNLFPSSSTPSIYLSHPAIPKGIAVSLEASPNFATYALIVSPNRIPTI